MAIDLGMKHLAATASTDRTTALWSGGELAALERHFDKLKSKTTRSRSNKSYTLNQKRSRQRTNLLHSFTKSLVNDTDSRGVSTTIVGDLTDIREGKNWGDSGNQQLHKWPFERIVKMLTYIASDVKDLSLSKRLPIRSILRQIELQIQKSKKHGVKSYRIELFKKIYVKTIFSCQNR